jgi:hypothetical protein
MTGRLSRPRFQPRNPPWHVAPIDLVFFPEPLRQARLLGQRDVHDVDDHGQGEQAQQWQGRCYTLAEGEPTCTNR